MDMYEVTPSISYEAYKIANWARDNGVEYAQKRDYYEDLWNDETGCYVKVLKTWDNEADAYRHFLWNAGMTRVLGSNVATIVANRHETANWTADQGVFISEVTKLDVPLASLMDLYNNNVARIMASSPEYQGKSYDELFDLAINEGRLITSLGQVPETFGFSKEYVFEKNIGDEKKQVVKSIFDFKNGTVEFLSPDSVGADERVQDAVKEHLVPNGLGIENNKILNEDKQLNFLSEFDPQQFQYLFNQAPTNYSKESFVFEREFSAGWDVPRVSIEADGRIYEGEVC